MERALVLDVTNSWTDKQEELLKKWYKESKAQNWKHLKASRHFGFMNNLLGVPVVAGVATAATASFGSIDTESKCTNNVVLQYIISVGLMILAILGAVNTFLKYSELSEKHTNSATRFRNFSNSIESELVLPRDDRLNGKIFIKQAQKRFNELIEICPVIPQWVDKSYKKHLDNMKLLECGDLDAVLINDINSPQTNKNEDNTKVSNDDSDDNSDNDDSDSDDSDSDNSDNDDSDSNSSSSNKNTLQTEVNQELERQKAMDRLERIETRSVINRFNNYF